MKVTEAQASALLDRRRGGSIPPTEKVCATCGNMFTAVWARSKHCETCGPISRMKASKRGATARKIGQSDAIAEIQRTLGRQTTAMTDVLERDPFLWSRIFSVPYSLDASKNRRWSLNGKSPVFLTRSVRSYSDGVILAVKAAMQGQPVVQNKVWLSFFVEKENHRSDAINVVDTLCDAIKVALDLDDRWFCIDRVDWAVKKHDQNIIIKISQTTDRDAIVCSHCGEIKDLENFGFKRGGPFGRSRVCRPCVAVLSKHARLKRPTA